MTERKTTTRPRRRAGVSSIPARLQRWFAGEVDKAPWCALVYSSYMLLQDRWREWRAEHPDGQPPAGFEWLDGPDRYRPDEVKTARRLLRSFERRFPEQAGKW